MNLIKLFSAMAIILIVAGCTGTPEEQKAKRQLAVELAIDRIEQFNAMGVDPVQLDERELLALDTVCVLLPVAGVELEVDPEVLKTAIAVCQVIRKAAAAYDPPEVAPEAEAAPAAS